MMNGISAAAQAIYLAIVVRISWLVRVQDNEKKVNEKKRTYVQATVHLWTLFCAIHLFRCGSGDLGFDMMAWCWCWPFVVSILYT